MQFSCVQVKVGLVLHCSTTTHSAMCNHSVHTLTPQSDILIKCQDVFTNFTKVRTTGFLRRVVGIIVVIIITHCIIAVRMMSNDAETKAFCTVAVMLRENPFDCFISSTPHSAARSALLKRDTACVQASSLLKERAVKVDMKKIFSRKKKIRMSESKKPLIENNNNIQDGKSALLLLLWESFICIVYMQQGIITGIIHGLAILYLFEIIAIY